MKGFLTILVLGLIIIGVIYLATDGNFFRSEGKMEEEGPSQEDIDAAQALYDRAQKARPDEALALYEKAVAEYGGTPGAYEAYLELGGIYKKRGEHRKALDAYEKSLPYLEAKGLTGNVKDVEQQIALLKTLLGDNKDDGTNLTVADTQYIVRAGDTFTGIARKFGLSVEQLKLANDRTRDFLGERETIRVTRKMPFLTVSKTDLTLELHFDDKRVKTYPVGIGKGELTPAGIFTIGQKTKDPTWFRPGKTPIPNNDPQNILGTRWMALVSENPSLKGYGIHGTTVPSSVPGRRSAGCIRMLNKDVEELFEWVPTGTKVVITEK